MGKHWKFAGIRIPKPLIEQCGFGDTVDLRVDRNRLIIAADRAPWQDWAKAFAQAADAGAEDESMMDSTASPNDFDRDEWKW
jgi:antitoxin MazE